MIELVSLSFWSFFLHNFRELSLVDINRMLEGDKSDSLQGIIFRTRVVVDVSDVGNILIS